MALTVTCTMHGTATVLHVRQSGWANSPRWSRYYDIIATGYALSLEDLKAHVEHRWNAG